MEFSREEELNLSYKTLDQPIFHALVLYFLKFANKSNQNMQKTNIWTEANAVQVLNIAALSRKKHDPTVVM